AGAAHPHAARVLRLGFARSHLRHPLQPAHGPAAVRDHRDPAHVPRVRLLLVAGARAHQVAEDLRAAEPARLHERGVPGRAHLGTPHVAGRRLPRDDRLRRALHVDGHQRVQEAGPQLTPADPAGSRLSSATVPMTTRGPHLTFYGVRGSTPCDGARYSRYGGNTSSVALEAPRHTPIIFD